VVLLHSRPIICLICIHIYIYIYIQHIYIHIYVCIYAYVPKGLLLVHSLNHFGPAHFLKLLSADVTIVLLSLICTFILLFQNSAIHVVCVLVYVYAFTPRYLSVYASIFISLCIADFVTPPYFIRGPTHQFNTHVSCTEIHHTLTRTPTNIHIYTCVYVCMCVCVHMCIYLDRYI